MWFNITKLILANAIALCFTLTSATHAAPGINCKKAQTESELAVCSDPSLLQLDADVANAYSHKRSELSGDPVEKKLLLKEQRIFLKGVSTCRSDKDCLNAKLSHRKAQLLGEDTNLSASPRSPQFSGAVGTIIVFASFIVIGVLGLGLIGTPFILAIRAAHRSKWWILFLSVLGPLWIAALIWALIPQRDPLRSSANSVSHDDFKDTMDNEDLGMNQGETKIHIRMTGFKARPLKKNINLNSYNFYLSSIILDEKFDDLEIFDFDQSSLSWSFFESETEVEISASGVIIVNLDEDELETISSLTEGECAICAVEIEFKLDGDSAALNQGEDYELVDSGFCEITLEEE